MAKVVVDVSMSLDGFVAGPHDGLGRGLGEGGAALAVVLAGVLDDRLQSLLLDRPLATYQSVVESEAYLLDLSWFLYSVLNHFDIPDLIGSLGPRPCWIVNAADSDGETLPESEVLARYTGAVQQSGDEPELSGF